MDPTQIQTRTVASSCTHCGATFDATSVHLGGRQLLVSTVCGDCVDPPDDGTPHGPPSRPDQLDRIGVNVRRYADATLDDLGHAPSLVFAARNFVTDTMAADRWTSVRGLFLVGATGVGKTHAAVAVVRALLDAGATASQVVFDRSPRLCTSIQDTYGTGRTSKILQARERALLWVLDDLGSEKATDDTLRILHDLIDAREGHPTLITSNLTPVGLGERYRDATGWARVASRFGPQNFRMLRLQGRDRRFLDPMSETA